MIQKGNRKGRENIGYFESSAFLHSSERIWRQVLFAADGRCTDSAAENRVSCPAGTEMN